MREIDQLRQAVQDRQAELDQERESKNRRRAREKEKRAFDALPTVTRHEFWCVGCQLDFTAWCYKKWSDYHRVGSWQTFCPRCERMAYRHVNGKTSDPYYEQSVKVRVMRNEALRDMLRPGEYGFQMLYGDPFEHYYRRFQERYEDIYNKYQAWGVRGDTIGSKADEDRIHEEIMYGRDIYGDQ